MEILIGFFISVIFVFIVSFSYVIDSWYSSYKNKKMTKQLNKDVQKKEIEILNCLTEIEEQDIHKTYCNHCYNCGFVSINGNYKKNQYCPQCNTLLHYDCDDIIIINKKYYK